MFLHFRPSAKVQLRWQDPFSELKGKRLAQLKSRSKSRCRHWKSNGITCEEIWSFGRRKGNFV